MPRQRRPGIGTPPVLTAGTDSNVPSAARGNTATMTGLRCPACTAVTVTANTASTADPGAELRDQPSE